MEFIMPFKLPSLDYNYDALEPHFDAKTMEIHHSKHHNAYVEKLNAALSGESDVLSLDELMEKISDYPVAVRNNGGGHFNHSLFWQVISPSGRNVPQEELMAAIENSFGSFEKFKEEFSNAAATRFGSGWAWLCFAEGKLNVCSTANQDNPLMDIPESHCQGVPILGLDVWEHAYYLKFQNRRPDYINSFWNVVNWDKVGELYSSAKHS